MFVDGIEVFSGGYYLFFYRILFGKIYLLLFFGYLRYSLEKYFVCILIIFLGVKINLLMFFM